MSAMVSVIIPTYGRPDNLKRAVESVRSQTFDNWELIIVDDNNPHSESRVATEEVVNKFTFDNRIIYIQHAKNCNGSVARNTGIKVSRGEYVAFLDDDDEYLPNRLETMVSNLEKDKNREFGGAFTGCIFKKNGKIFHKLNYVRSGNYLVETLACTFQMGSGSNLFIRRDLLIQLQGFDESFIRHQDYEFLVRFFEKYDLLGINEPLFIRNQTDNNIPNIDKMIQIKEKYLSKYDVIINRLTISEKRFIYQSQFIQLGEMALKVKEFKKAKLFYKQGKGYGSYRINVYLRRNALWIKAKINELLKNRNYLVL